MNFTSLINTNLKNKEIRYLLKKYKTMNELYSNFDNLTDDIKREIEKIKKDYQEDEKTRIISYNDLEYPEYLKELSDFPPFLFLRGKKLDIKNSVGVIGTRKCSGIGIRSCEYIIKGLKQYENICIISGLANGIDKISHQSAIKNDIYTIAVIPTSIDDCYPYENKKLKEQIEEVGTVLTEVRRGQKLQKLNFVLRNRIIAGLSRAIYLVESPKSGGSLITAKFADIYGREIYATTSNIFDKSFEGCSDLIMKNKAKLITCAEDIAYEYGWRKKSEEIFSNS